MGNAAKLYGAAHPDSRHPGARPCGPAPLFARAPGARSRYLRANGFWVARGQ